VPVWDKFNVKAVTLCICELEYSSDTRSKWQFFFVVMILHHPIHPRATHWTYKSHRRKEITYVDSDRPVREHARFTSRPLVLRADLYWQQFCRGSVGSIAYRGTYPAHACTPESEAEFCSVPDQGSLALFSPASETLRADSRAVTCCPDDGWLTFGGWVVVVEELKPTAISIY
jgi:hypothetical protein